MKIAIVCYPTYGGSGVVATELGLGLAARGHEVHFVSYAPPFRMPGFHANIHYHLEYIGWLSDRRRWLAGDEFSRADAAAAAHLSALDYQGDVPWAEHALAKDWYARVKSRPTFRDILADHIPGIRPAADYANLDF